jgi:glutaryl-CoA dehydrogenase
MDDLLLFDRFLSEEEKMIRDSVSDYIQAQMLPRINQHFEEGSFPTKFIKDAAQLGLFGITIPSEYGGADASYLSYGLVCQELEKGDSALRSCVSVQSSLCMYPIFSFGSAEQKQKYLPLLARGELIGCFGLTEPDSGSDPSSMKTNAKKTKDGWLLNGSKMWITNAPIADIAIVWAKTDMGIRGFIVDTHAKGVQCPEIKNKMSLRASITGELVFNQVFIPNDCILPGTEKGLACALACLNQARYGISWGAIGAAISCFDTCKNYLLERQQFGRPLASFQLIQNDLALMYTEIIKAQSINLQLGLLKDAKQDHHVMTSLTKGNACREALKIARSCRNLLGANGISLDYHVIRHMLNLESVFTYEGTDNVHKLVLGRHITGINAFDT